VDIIKARIRSNCNLSSNWTVLNPILFLNEIGYETDTGKIKIGDGIANWISLVYMKHSHAESEITNLSTDLALKALINSPALTGTPTSSAPPAGTNTTQIATTAYAMAAAPNVSYRIIGTAFGSHIASRVAGTYMLPGGDALAISGTGTLYPIIIFPIYAADFPTINGLAPKLRIRVIVSVNAVAPTGNFTVGLYPINSGAGGTGVKIYTTGTLVSGSAVPTVITPAANSMSSIVSSEFALPSDGVYCLACVTTATVATSSLVHINAMLQMRNA